MKKNIILIIFIIIFLIIWEYAASYSSAINYFVSSPTASFDYARINYLNLLNSTITTSLEAILGLIIATVFSFAIMFICLIYPKILKIILPIFVTSQVLPIITLAPFFIILFGMGILSKIAMVVLMCFFPVFVNFSAGVNSISNETKELLYTYDANKYFTIFKIILPLSTPNIFTGLKLGTTMAMMGAIVVEFLGAIDGLGKNLYLAPKNSKPELMVCSIVLTVFLGWFLFKTVEKLEKKIGKWYI
ncbi:MAG: ABC transporter permease subunit [Altibacter sp.]|uniref:ABC transporter permease n=1 Tax=Altibacter sp. TaxID=2024823 RepID=UPI001D85C03E|nr:ABC transporter permease subunit [Altibacter sp.]MBZ0328290.1 ABC transporter permease subunit [Altibacter sp.]